MHHRILSEQLCDMHKSDEYIMYLSSSMATFQHQPIQQYLFGMYSISSLKMDIYRLFRAVVAVIVLLLIIRQFNNNTCWWRSAAKTGGRVVLLEFSDLERK